jgi:hypothetical protein
MISRLTATAALFAVLATASIALAAGSEQRHSSSNAAPAVKTLPKVVIVAERQAGR